MTAKEYIKNYGSDYESEGAMFLFTADELIKFIGNYAIMKCKEQREKCAKGLKKTIYGRTINAFLNPDEVEIIKNNILNAKEPEL